jgi:hypothetical protein
MLPLSGVEGAAADLVRSQDRPMSRYTIVFACSAAFFLLGAFGFSAKGIPIGYRRSVKGTWGMVLGLISILIGAGIALVGMSDVLGLLVFVQHFGMK